MEDFVGYYAQLPNGELATVENATLVLFDKKAMKQYLKTIPNSKKYQMVKLGIDAFFERIEQGEKFIFDKSTIALLEYSCFEGDLANFIFLNVNANSGLELIQVSQNPLAPKDIYPDEDDCEIIYSPLCQTYRESEVSVRVEIYRGEDETTWILEVEDQAKSSFVYEQRFDNDKEAWSQFESDIAEFGIGYFISEEPQSNVLH